MSPNNEHSAEFCRGAVWMARMLGDESGEAQYSALLAEAEAREHLNKLHGECDCGWKKSAAEFCNGMEYYRGLVVKIGEIIGHESHIAQDGSDMGEVLCAGVPDLVAAMKAREASQPTAAEVIEACRVALEEIRAAVTTSTGQCGVLGTNWAECDYCGAVSTARKEPIPHEKGCAFAVSTAALALCARWKEAK